MRSNLIKAGLLTIGLVCSMTNQACSKKINQVITENNQAKVTSLLPNRGYPGQTMTIVGTSFGSDAEKVKVDFGGIVLKPTSVTDKAIQVLIPEFKGQSDLEVLVSIDGKPLNKQKFEYKEREGVSPSSGGTRVTNSGHLVSSEMSEIRKVRGYGPFVALKDGGIFTVPEGSVDAYISRDEGVNWVGVPVLSAESFSMWTPTVTVALDGTIVVAFSNGKELKPLKWNKTTHSYDPNAALPTYTVRSTDGGRTWEKPVKLHSEWTGMIRDIVTLKNGAIVVSTMKMLNNPGRHTVLTYTSKDQGKTWAASNILDQSGAAGDHAGYMEATLKELKDGRLWMLIRTNFDYLYETFSSDDGKTWSDPQKTSIEASSSPPAFKRLASGRLVLVWNRLYPEGKTDYFRLGGDSNLVERPTIWHRDELSIMFSDDEGKTWSRPKVIAKNHLHAPSTLANAWDSTKWLSYPHLFELKPGVIWLTTGHGGLKIEFNENDYL
ncbi:exo-alpha-sialidase [Sphingobacterium sp. SYP-B4668]|uniref:exo-alpha-sialidase n=1 Tax=Sphingobacterium sp. SYP-B4668 TaxID=2996035 RepID=UPI0022DE60FD|nr:exo-alpha-sialidase [Sphingobacterium sp. SYP-B4668]